MKTRLVVGIAAAIALALLTSNSSDATTWRPSSPLTVVTPNTTGAHPDIVTHFNIPSPDANFATPGVIAYTDGNFTIANDAAVTNGAIVGNLTADATLGLSNNACTEPITPTFVFKESDTSTTDTIAAAGPPSNRLVTMNQDNRGPVTEGIYRDAGTAGQVDSADILLFGPAVANATALVGFAADEKHAENISANTRYDYGESIYRDTGATAGQVDGTDVHLSGPAALSGTALIAFQANEKHVDTGTANQYDASPPNSLPDYVDATPSFDVTLYTPAGGGTLVQPIARYADMIDVADLKVLLQLVVFDKGALLPLPNHQMAIAALGFPTFTILQDPVSAPSNSSIGDFCTALSSTTTLFGTTQDNPATTTVNEGGAFRITSPGAARTTEGVVQAISLRDADDDGVENNLDPCPTISNAIGAPNVGGDDWDPRTANTANFANGWDGDGDGIPNASRVLPAGNWVADACDDYDNDADNNGTPDTRSGATANHAACPLGTNNVDEDCDLWLNRIDNCPNVANGDAKIAVSFSPDGDSLDDTITVNYTSGYLVNDVIRVSAGILGSEELATVHGILSGPPRFTVTDLGFSHTFDDPVTNEYVQPNEGQNDQDVPFPANVPDLGPRGDGIGKECETGAAQTTPTGHYHRAATLGRNCIGGTDIDQDGVCAAGAAGLTDPNDTDLDKDFDNDGVLDGSDNCISVANPALAGFTQGDVDLDGVGDACDPADFDGDFYTDRTEYFVGTDPAAKCATSSSHNAWPADLNNDTFSDGTDIVAIAGSFGLAAPPEPPRRNVAPDPPDGFVDGTDIIKVADSFGKQC